MSAVIQKGSTVQVHYTGKRADGSIFDSSRGREALTYTQGSGMLLAGFEQAVLGKQVGDVVTVTLSPKEAYGEYDPRQVFAVDREQVPSSIPLEVGTKLELSSEKGVLYVSIKEVTPEEVILDGNHELAGETLTFEIEVIAVK